MNRYFVSIDPSAPFPEHPTRLEPIGNGQFRVEALTGGGPVGETVRFVEENGQVVRMYIGGSFADRVKDR
jgi:hypothetical protein